MAESEKPRKFDPCLISHFDSLTESDRQDYWKIYSICHHINVNISLLLLLRLSSIRSVVVFFLLRVVEQTLLTCFIGLKLSMVFYLFICLFVCALLSLLNKMAAETILSFSNSNVTAQSLIVMSYSVAYR